jgi:hypothetical protein
MVVLVWWLLVVLGRWLSAVIECSSLVDLLSCWEWGHVLVLPAHAVVLVVLLPVVLLPVVLLPVVLLLVVLTVLVVLLPAAGGGWARWSRTRSSAGVPASRKARENARRRCASSRQRGSGCRYAPRPGSR